MATQTDEREEVTTRGLLAGLAAASELVEARQQALERQSTATAVPLDALEELVVEEVQRAARARGHQVRRVHAQVFHSRGEMSVQVFGEQGGQDVSDVLWITLATAAVGGARGPWHDCVRAAAGVLDSPSGRRQVALWQRQRLQVKLAQRVTAALAMLTAVAKAELELHAVEAVLGGGEEVADALAALVEDWQGSLGELVAAVDALAGAHGGSRDAGPGLPA